MVRFNSSPQNPLHHALTFLSNMSEKIKTHENERERPNIQNEKNEQGALNILSEIIVQMQNGCQNSQFCNVHFPKGQDP